MLAIYRIASEWSIAYKRYDMPETPSPRRHGSLQQLGIILNPKNLLRTLAASFPGASSVLEIQSQIDNAKTGLRINVLEETDVELQTKLKKLENAQPQPRLELSDWPIAVGNYMKRMVDFAVFYDGGFHSPSKRGRELFHVVAHGCMVAPNQVLTCTEALALAQEVAEAKGGYVTLLVGYARYAFRPEAPTKGSGLVLCELTERNEKHWERTKRLFESIEYPGLLDPPLDTPVESSVMPWIGQEIGFLHNGEATNIERQNGLTSLQFDTSVISHFRKITKEVWKSFITDVLPGRILKAGSPVFTRKGVLVGVISDTENYESDAGRRAVVKSLLGHPRFTIFKKS